MVFNQSFRIVSGVRWHFLLNEINISRRPALSSFPHTHTHKQPPKPKHKNGVHCLHLHRLRRGPQGVQGPGTYRGPLMPPSAAPLRVRRNFLSPHIPIAFSAGSAPYLTSRPPHSSSFRPSLCPRSSRPTSTPSSAPTPAVVSPPSSPSAPRRTPSVRSSTAAGRCSV